LLGAGGGDTRLKLVKENFDKGRERSNVGVLSSLLDGGAGAGAGEEGRLDGLKKDGVLIAAYIGGKGEGLVGLMTIYERVFVVNKNQMGPKVE
jgi:hypothetical protein